MELSSDHVTASYSRSRKLVKSQN